MSGRFVRASKYRHVFGKSTRKEFCYDNLHISRNAWDSNLIKANPEFLSVNWEASGGGAFAVIPLGERGKLPDQIPLFRGHTGPVLDTDWNPFNDHVISSASDDGNYIYFRALQEVQKLRSPNAIAVFGDELVHLHRGQGMDLFWRDSLACPTEEEYLEMVGNKTGGLFRLGVKLMQGESRSLVDCIPLVNLVGLIFQIRDDYLNLASTEYSDNKGLCEDLTEGKFSFPIIHAIRADPLNTQLLNILRQKTNDVDVKRYAVAYMESMGTFEYTRTVVNTLIERAKKVANEIDEGRGKTARVLAILDMMVLPEGKVRPGGRAAEGEKKEEVVQQKEELQTPGTLKALEIMAGRQDMQKENLAKIVALARKEKEKEKESL